MNKGHTEISVSVNMESFDSIVTYEQDVLHRFWSLALSHILELITPIKSSFFLQYLMICFIFNKMK